jgi:predicted acetyltransferase
MPDGLEILPAALDQKPVLAQLLELYSYDFSEFTGEDVDPGGRYGYDYLDRYWDEAGRFAYLFRLNGKWAGFALIRDIEQDGVAVHWMAEFFVMRKYRRMKVGWLAAQVIFDLHPGCWQVGQIAANLPAQAFWRQTIADYTGGSFEEIELEGWDGPAQEFMA